MYRLLLFIFLALSLTHCAFVSKRIEGRERQEYEHQNGSNTHADESLSQIQIKDYEKKMNSQREKELYSKLLPWFKNEDERLEFLNLVNLRQKQEWANEKGIWRRAKSPNEEMRQLMQSNDIAIGMPMDYVTRSWGEPQQKEVSGNPLFKNERWKYIRSISTQEGFRQEKRNVYFEGGKVTGWETE